MRANRSVTVRQRRKGRHTCVTHLTRDKLEKQIANACYRKYRAKFNSRMLVSRVCHVECVKKTILRN